MREKPPEYFNIVDGDSAALETDGSHAISPPPFPSVPGVACLQGVQLDNENVQLKALLQKCVKKGRATLHGTKP